MSKQMTLSNSQDTTFKKPSQLKELLRRLRKSKGAMVGLTILIFILLVFVPDEVGKLGNRVSRIKMADISDCNDDAGRSSPCQCLEMEARVYRIVSNFCLMVPTKH